MNFPIAMQLALATYQTPGDFLRSSLGRSIFEPVVSALMTLNCATMADLTSTVSPVSGFEGGLPQDASIILSIGSNALKRRHISIESFSTSPLFHMIHPKTSLDGF